jgi:hypothetical protein
MLATMSDAGHQRGEEREAERAFAPLSDQPREAGIADASERLGSDVGNRAFGALIAGEGAGILADGTVHPDVTATIARAQGSGGALDATARQRFSTSLGDPLGDVRIHTDAGADALARSVAARAFTTGSDVFFASGEYRPGSSDGDRLLAHELAHVVQQRGASTSGPLTVSEPGDALETEADALARELTGASRESGHAFAAHHPRERLDLTALRLLQSRAGNAAVSQRLGRMPGAAGGSMLMRDAAQDELQQTFDRNGGDAFVGGVKAGVEEFRPYRANKQRSGKDVPGWKRIETAARKFTSDLPAGAGWEAALGKIAKTKLSQDELSLVEEIDTISEAMLAETRDILLDGKFERANHKYTLKVSHEATGGENVGPPDDRGFVKKLLTTRVVINYTNRLGEPWLYTAVYDVGGLTLDASIGIDVSIGGTALEMGKSIWKDVALGFGTGKAEHGVFGGLGKAIGVLGQDLKNLNEKGEEAHEKIGEPEGGLGFGLMKIELDEAEADGVGQFWGPGDIEGPVLTVAFVNFEGALGFGASGSYKYEGINGLEFVGVGMPSRMTFAQIGKSEPKMSLGAGGKLEFKPVGGGAGYAKLSG